MNLAKFKGKNVVVHWDDPQGFINDELSTVECAKCHSIGKLVDYDRKKLILRTAVYDGSTVGDYTAICLGAVTGVENLK